MRKIITLTILFFSSNLLAWVSVGLSPNFGTCDYTDIQSAIDSGEEEIRVLNNQSFVENLTIDRSIDIRGGYTSCLTAQLNSVSNDNTVIKGSDIFGPGLITGLPVIRISLSIEALPVVRLYNLTLQDALDLQAFSGGRGIEVGDSSVFLQINDSIIKNNKGEYGAGIYVGDPVEATVNLNNSQIIKNDATVRGGGISCHNNHTNINITNNSLIYDNTAQEGGGIYATSGCHIVVDSGVDIENSGDLYGVMGNHATINGGGIFARSNAIINLYGNRYALGILGNSTAPVTLANNTAGNNGGGLYADRSTIVNIEDAIISNNTAGNNGGALYVSDESEINISRSSHNSCWSLDSHCSIFSNNKANQFGGGIYAEDTAQINIDRSNIFANRANIGTFVYIRDLGTKATLKNNFIYSNGNNGLDGYNDDYVMRSYSSGELEILHNTISNNDTVDDKAIFGISNGSKLNLFNSIVFNNQNVLGIESGAYNKFFCVIVNETDSLSNVVGDGIEKTTPTFIDSVNNNYHLDFDSQGIDFCEPVDSSITGLLLDFDGQERPWDDASVTNYLGSADAGADETYINDYIFNNSFE